MSNQSAYETWTWEGCQQAILSLKNRQGYKDTLWILGFEVLDNGQIFDPIHKRTIYDPNKPSASDTPLSHSAAPEIYCLLTTYANSDDLPLTGEWLSWATFDVLRRPDLTPEDCYDLLMYENINPDEHNLESIPFFGERLELGDLSYIVNPLPRIPVRVVLWHGDEDMPPGGTLHFDRVAPFYLGNLVRELAWLTVWRLRQINNPGLLWGAPY
jgi:hypothetical protein